jgi:hypothetical protein
VKKILLSMISLISTFSLAFIAAPVAVSAEASDKVYDGSNDAEVTNAVGNGSIIIQLVSSDSGGGGTAIATLKQNTAPLPATEYLTVNFQGNIFRTEISGNGAVLSQLVAYGPSETNKIVIPEGTITLDKDGQIVKFIQVTATTMPPLTEDRVGVSPAYSFEPSGITFSQQITITLGYGMDQVSMKISSITLAYYSPNEGWIDLQSEGTRTASGEATGSVNHFTPFAVIGRKSVAAFQLSNLVIKPSQNKIWGVIPFVKITGENTGLTADVTNVGGMAGTYQGILKLNGENVAQHSITLNPGQTSQLSFDLKGLGPGHYVVEVGNLRGELTTSRVFNFFEIIGFIILLASAVWGIVLWIKRYRANPQLKIQSSGLPGNHII